MKRVGIPNNLGVGEWENILDEMIWTFDYILDDEKYNPFPDSMADDDEDILKWLNRERTPEEKKRFNEYSINSFELEERKQRGLKLFATYFQSLWD